jgi:manganese/zinc/iron transport system substrate-binding protein
MGMIFRIICLLLFGCSRVEIKNESTKPKVLSTIAQIGDLVSEIGGDRIESHVLVRGELNPHTYELVKGDDDKIQGANRLFYNGLGLEHGASVAAQIEAHPHAFAVGDAIRQKFPQQILWKEGTLDPHIWMDISLWAEAVDPIAEQLIEMDPAGKEEYLERARLLKEKMVQIDQRIVDHLQKIPAHRRYLVTSHDAFHYFARRYLAEAGEAGWETRFAAPEGLAPDGQLTGADLQKIVDHLSAHRIEILFPESNVSRDSIRKIASAGKYHGLNVRICQEVLYGDSMRGNYLEAMIHNADTIEKNL